MGVGEKKKREETDFFQSFCITDNYLSFFLQKYCYTNFERLTNSKQQKRKNKKRDENQNILNKFKLNVERSEKSFSNKTVVIVEQRTVFVCVFFFSKRSLYKMLFCFFVEYAEKKVMKKRREGENPNAERAEAKIKKCFLAAFC